MGPQSRQNLVTSKSKEGVMAARARDVVPVSTVRRCPAGLAEAVTRQGGERISAGDGGRGTAPADGGDPDADLELDAEHALLVLVQGALEGLEDMARGRVLGEDELDHAATAAPALTSRHRG